MATVRLPARVFWVPLLTLLEACAIALVNHHLVGIPVDAGATIFVFAICGLMAAGAIWALACRAWAGVVMVATHAVGGGLAMLGFAGQAAGLLFAGGERNVFGASCLLEVLLACVFIPLMYGAKRAS